jgi:glucosamine--fructose-6-phosphate aminotransferase (isomerizing)
VCGVVAYAGRRPAAPILLEGLRRLEYRGYDGSGLAIPKREATPPVSGRR